MKRTSTVTAQCTPQKQKTTIEKPKKGKVTIKTYVGLYLSINVCCLDAIFLSLLMLLRCSCKSLACVVFDCSKYWTSKSSSSSWSWICDIKHFLCRYTSVNKLKVKHVFIHGWYLNIAYILFFYLFISRHCDIEYEC